ncbi:sulfotransferase [Ferrimonas pelagia]|uniref:Sulfotransferase n=1 Tax=Ferrimonas pelagia TaxID=1177826 RepID=A0ABP9ETQ8_9GAMM
MEPVKSDGAKGSLRQASALFKVKTGALLAEELAPQGWLHWQPKSLPASSRPRLRLRRTELLDAEELLQLARQKTGLTELGAWRFLPSFRRLVRGLNEEAELNAAGRRRHHERLLEILCTRLRFEAYCQRYPEILQEPLAAPVVIVGLPGTGSTLLQRLIASDPRFYSAAWWETRFPVPFAAGDVGKRDDPRIEAARHEIATMLEAEPMLRHSHPFDARAADEDSCLLEQAFFSTNPEAAAHLPNYSRWLAGQDPTEGYRYLRALLQFLQWQKRQRGESAERWVLKSPCHLHNLAVLLKVFPGAKIVQTHRDPEESLPALIHLIKNLWQMNSDRVQPRVLARHWSLKMAAALTDCIQLRKCGAETQFHDVRHEQIEQDPLQVIIEIYASVGMPMTSEAWDLILATLAHEGGVAPLPDRAALPELGLTLAEIRQEFASYSGRFLA